MSATSRLIQKRAAITALPLYYSGHLLKKNKSEKDFKKYFGELRGATLFLYKDGKDDTFTEKLDLEELKSMKMGHSFQRKVPSVFTLSLPIGKVQLKMENPEKGEEWRAYILTVTKKEIPSKLQLLPGQMMHLKEVLAQRIEGERILPILRPPIPPKPSFLLSASPPSLPSAKDEPDIAPEVPACFFNVTRQEAEHMLEANPEYGHMILRPSTLANTYALTLRQVTSSGPVMRNYKLTPTGSGFVINLETAVKVSSLNDVLKYFLEKTEYRLHPYKSSQIYDTHIENISITLSAPKTVPWVHVAPLLRSETKEEHMHPPTEPEDSYYVVPHDHSPDDPKLKLAQLDRELQEVLKSRRSGIFGEDDTDDDTDANLDEVEFGIYEYQIS